jgi:hypothetical protein
MTIFSSEKGKGVMCVYSVASSEDRSSISLVEGVQVFGIQEVRQGVFSF